jgi:hypothetical protein
MKFTIDIISQGDRHSSHASNLGLKRRILAGLAKSCLHRSKRNLGGAIAPIPTVKIQTVVRRTVSRQPRTDRSLFLGTNATHS